MISEAEVFIINKIKKIKNTAIACLSDNWGRSIVVILMIVMMNVIILLTERSIYEYYRFNGMDVSFNLNSLFGSKMLVLINIIRLAVTIIVTFPIYTGAAWWYFHTVKGEKNELKEVYVCFSNIRIYLKTLFLAVSVAFCRILVGLPVLAASYFTIKMLHFAYSDYSPDNGKFAVLTGCAAALMVCLVFLYIYYSMGFALSSYIFVLNPDLKVFDCIKMSHKLMKNKKGDLVKLYVSFIPWLFGALLVFPIFFIAPYFAMSIAAFANDILKHEHIVDYKYTN